MPHAKLSRDRVVDSKRVTSKWVDEQPRQNPLSSHRAKNVISNYIKTGFIFNSDLYFIFYFKASSLIPTLALLDRSRVVYIYIIWNKISFSLYLFFYAIAKQKKHSFWSFVCLWAYFNFFLKLNFAKTTRKSVWSWKIR
jgi:hypothetical protein